MGIPNCVSGICHHNSATDMYRGMHNILYVQSRSISAGIDRLCSYVSIILLGMIGKFGQSQGEVTR